MNDQDQSRYLPTYIRRNGERYDELAALGVWHLAIYIELCRLGAWSSEGWVGSLRLLHGSIVHRYKTGPRKGTEAEVVSWLVGRGWLTIDRSGLSSVYRVTRAALTCQSDPDGGQLVTPTGVRVTPVGVGGDPDGGQSDPHGGQSDPDGGQSDPDGGHTFRIQKGEEGEALLPSVEGEVRRGAAAAPIFDPSDPTPPSLRPDGRPTPLWSLRSCEAQAAFAALGIDDLGQKQLVDEAGPAEVARQLAWYPYRDHSWCQRGPLVALRTYCRQAQPEPPEAARLRREAEARRAQAEVEAAQETQAQAEERAYRTELDRLTPAELEAHRVSARQRLGQFYRGDSGRVWEGALCAEVLREWRAARDAVAAPSLAPAPMPRPQPQSAPSPRRGGDPVLAGDLLRAAGLTPPKRNDECVE